MEESEEPEESGKREKSDRISIFARIIDFIFGRGKMDPERQNQRNICRQLKKSGYYYYHFSKEELRPEFARLVFQIYKIVAPLRDFFLNHNDMKSYQQLVSVYMLSEQQKNALIQVQPDTIMKKSQDMNFTALVQECKDNYSLLKDSYKPAQINETNEIFTGIYKLCSFCLFDFYMLLKKFDPALGENRFDVEPKFQPTSREFVADNVDQFLTEYYGIIDVENWGRVFEVLNAVPNFRYDQVEEFMKIPATLKVLEKRRVMARMVKLMRRDSTFEFDVTHKVMDIVSPFLEETVDAMESLLGGMHREIRQNEISIFTEKLFAGVEMVPLSNYNDDRSVIYINKGLPGFEFTEQAFYINSFNEQFLKKEIANFAEIFAVRGKSKIPNYVNDVTAKYHALIEQCNNLQQLDKLLDEKFSTGFRLKTLLDKYKKDPDSSIELTDELNKLNEKVKLIISTEQESINILQETFSELLKDRIASKHELVTNWLELDSLLKTKSYEGLNKICIHLQDFIGLVKVLID